MKRYLAALGLLGLADLAAAFQPCGLGLRGERTPVAAASALRRHGRFPVRERERASESRDESERTSPAAAASALPAPREVMICGYAPYLPFIQPHAIHTKHLTCTPSFSSVITSPTVNRV